MGVWTGSFVFKLLGLVAVVGEEPLRCSDCFALENISLARDDTPLLRRFFSVVGVEPASLGLRSLEEDPLPAVPDTPGAPLSVVGAAAGFGASLAVGPSTAASSSSLPGEVPNILFSRPPWLEKLRRLFPARLMVSRWRSYVGRGNGNSANTRMIRGGELLQIQARVLI